MPATTTDDVMMMTDTDKDHNDDHQIIHASKELPVHIECFDNSNIQGTNPVSACVVFKDAKPSKKDIIKLPTYILVKRKNTKRILIWPDSCFNK